MRLMDSMSLPGAKQGLVHALAFFVSVLMVGAAITTCGGGGARMEVVVDTTVFGRVLSAIDETPCKA